MSNSITISLTTKRREDAEKISARAVELMKEKNCDLEFELFDADDGSCSGIGMAELHGEACGIAQRIIEGVVTSFSDIEMREQVSANGELYKELESHPSRFLITRVRRSRDPNSITTDLLCSHTSPPALGTLRTDSCSVGR